MIKKVLITKEVLLPDRIKLERFRKAPELGPRILFFSGGNALKGLSKKIIDYTHNSIHLITPFDSGGSSAKIREAYKMIAVGDLRNRLMALADQSVKGNPDIYRLFAFRLPKEENRGALLQTLFEMREGAHPMIKVIKQPMRTLICNHLGFFIERMTPGFDLQGASIGNLILTGGYLNNNRHIDTVLFLFSRLVEVRGYVKPTLEKLYNLNAVLEDNTMLIGQHLITGKEHEPIKTPVKEIFISELNRPEKPVTASIANDVENLIRNAELVCYPMGSFYTSVLSNLLPVGVAKAVAANKCPKVYIPNTFPDPEQKGIDMQRSVEQILSFLRKGEKKYNTRKLLDFILVDTKNVDYPSKIDTKKIKKMGIDIIDTELVTKDSFPYIHADKLLQILLSLT